ncbi:MAG TPA: hypothetical protein VFM58_18905 [Solirubrobacteraceae bacterium]|nr:hypothetical protein [Solirubrobacteraceae bacterium]
MKRRPSAAMLIALLALFVALGGPAQAARVVKRVTSASVKDHSLKTRDLSRKTVRQLKTPRNNSVTEAKIAAGAVTDAKVATQAIDTRAVRDRSLRGIDLGVGSVGAGEVADGSLTARELGRFYGRFQLKDPIPALHEGECWSGVPSGLAAEQAAADISQDLVIVTPDATWPQNQLTLTVKTESTTVKPGRFVLAACNVGSGGMTAAFRPSFRYLVVDVP